MGFYSRRHYQRVSPPLDTAADIRDRKNRALASERAISERARLFPVLTLENFDQASATQDSAYERELRLLSGAV